MSWYASYKYEDSDVTEETYPALAGLVEQVEQGVLSKEIGEQVFVTASTVHDIIGSGVVGDPKGKFSITVSGHANPEHKPASGWANDSIVINIYQDKE